MFCPNKNREQKKLYPLFFSIVADTGITVSYNIDSTKHNFSSAYPEEIVLSLFLKIRNV